MIFSSNFSPSAESKYCLTQNWGKQIFSLTFYLYTEFIFEKRRGFATIILTQRIFAVKFPISKYELISKCRKSDDSLIKSELITVYREVKEQRAREFIRYPTEATKTS
jgi:hypothetical protein